MKSIKYILATTLLLFVCIACSEDTDGTIYRASNEEATFESASLSYTFGADDPDVYEVVVKRGNAVGSASVAVAFKDESGLFSAPANAEFADGVYETTIPVTFTRSDLVVGKAYDVTITIPDNPVRERVTETTLLITRDYVWELFATGYYYCDLFGTLERELYKADEADRYKFASLYAEGVDFIFDVAEDGSMTMPGEPDSDGLYHFTTGTTYSDYGMLYLFFDPDPAYSLCDLDNQIIYVSNYYYVAAGYFGWLDDVFYW